MSIAHSAVFFGVEIPETLIASEMQNHQAGSLKEARNLAGRALASKALLLNRGEQLALQPVQEVNETGLQETYEEAVIREVLSEEVEAGSIDETAIRKIYDDQPNAFSTPPLLEASHILIAPREDDPQNWDAAKAQAIEIIQLLQESPRKFFNMAKTVSACPSRSDGGSLGQLRPGDVLNTIWVELLKLEAGEVAENPVKTEHGWHVVRLDHRVEGRRLPFEHVKSHIRSQLEVRAWTMAAAKYVDHLLRENSGQAPSLELSEFGELVHEDSKDNKVRSILGGVFSNPEQALKFLDDVTFSRVDEAAQEQNKSAGGILTEVIPGFVTAANDEAWTQIISCLRESQTPIQDCLSIIIKHQFPEKAKASHVLDITNRKPARTPEGRCHDSCC